MYSILFGRRKKFEVNNAETTYKVHYLGNVMTSLVKGGYWHGGISSTLNSTPSSGSLNNNYNKKEPNQDINIITNGKNKTDLSLSLNETNTDDDLDSNYSYNCSINKNLSNYGTNNLATSVDKPVKVLWENHLKHNGHAGLKMKLTLTQGGLKVDTKDHGLTEYYGHRIHFIQAHPLHPKLFIWVYQHVGKNLKTEIRCHAALCQRARDAKTIESLLNEKLQRTFLEYKREKRRQQNSRLCNTKNGGLLTGQIGTRKRTFRITRTYKPPVQHGMCSAPKLDDVLEEGEEEEPIEDQPGQLSQVKEEEEDEELVESGVDDNNNNIQEEEEVYAEDHVYIGNTVENYDDLDHAWPDLDNTDDDLEEDEDEDEEELLAKEIESIENKAKTENRTETDYLYNQSSLDYDLTQTTISSVSSKQYDNRPLTQQLMLSSSSSASSPTTSPSSSASSTPNHYLNMDSSNSNATTSTSFSSPSSINIPIDKIIEHNQLNLNKLKLNSDNHLLVKRVNSLNSKPKRLVNGDCMPSSNHKRVVNIEDEQKGFNEVSYEFLSDLSKSNVNDAARAKLNYSKSFTKNTTPAMKLSNELNSETGANLASSFNPFRRTNISKSFSAFTSRLKQQALANEAKKLSNLKEENIYNRHIVIKNSGIEVVAKLPLSTSSSLPSPTLSTCSNSSSSNSSNLNSNSNCGNHIVDSNLNICNDKDNEIIISL